jgi:biotin transport system substrate-specific component
VVAARLTRVPPFERGLTLGDFLVPIRVGERAATWQRNALMVSVGTLLIVLGAWISFNVPQIALGNVYVPANPYVPFSLQTFSVLFVGATLGFRRGVASTLLYLALGCIGLPVFAIDAHTGAHASGVQWIASIQSGRVVLGATGGYLVGFVLASGVVGRLAELGWDRSFLGSVAMMLIGSVAIYLVGLPWLAIAVGLDVPATLQFGLWPFIPGDVAKLLVAAVTLPIGWRVVSRRPNDR